MYSCGDVWTWNKTHTEWNGCITFNSSNNTWMSDIPVRVHGCNRYSIIISLQAHIRNIYIESCSLININCLKGIHNIQFQAILGSYKQISGGVVVVITYLFILIYINQTHNPDTMSSLPLGHPSEISQILNRISIDIYSLLVK